MGTSCSCVFSEAQNLKTTELKLQSPMSISVVPHDFKGLSLEKSIEIFEDPSCATPSLILPALSYLPDFYSRISHRLTGQMLEVLKSLPLILIDDSDIFELPSEISEDVLYFGQWEHEQPQGKGIQLNSDNSLYLGEFSKGRFKGRGRLIYPTGEYYEGEFRKSHAHGEGMLYFSSSRSISGVFSKGEIEGTCTIVWGNAVYTGNFCQGKKNGIGKLIQGDKTFEGEFVNDYIEGHGSCVWENGKKYSGEWVKNKMHGYGVFEWPDGRIYEGEYMNNMKDGIGKMMWPDGKVYFGGWSKGVQHGTAEYTFYNKKIEKVEKRKGRWFQGQRTEWLI